MAELNGAVFDRPIAAFRAIPYFARKSIELSLDALDASREELRVMEEFDGAPEDDENVVYDD